MLNEVKHPYGTPIKHTPSNDEGFGKQSLEGFFVSLRMTSFTSREKCLKNTTQS